LQLEQVLLRVAQVYELQPAPRRRRLARERRAAFTQRRDGGVQVVDFERDHGLVRGTNSERR
jgi:hypothetical protein